MSWESDIERAKKQLKLETNEMIRRMAVFLIRGYVSKTPVDEGVLRAAWNVSLDTPDFIDEGPGNQQIPSKLEGWPVIWFTNAQPYAVVVEYGLYPGLGEKTVIGGNPSGAGDAIFSSQAPQGMMELTNLELMNNLRQIAWR